MTREERTILQKLDELLRSEEVRGQIQPIVNRVRADLARKKEAVMSWEPIPLAIYRMLPPEIRSSWVFILRASANTGAERHPNSHQRMMSFVGSGDLQIGVETGSGIQWQSNVLVSDAKASLEQRWISIPQNVWHQPVVPVAADWVVVSFHTVPADELIEERPAKSASEKTRQMRYLEENKLERSSRTDQS